MIDDNDDNNNRELNKLTITNEKKQHVQENKGKKKKDEHKETKGRNDEYKDIDIKRWDEAR